ncbi:MAG: metal-dependent hydrolase [Candidatus Moraniibacteriota bacterium]
MYSGGGEDWLRMLLISFSVFGLVRFGGGYIFEKFTNHRGMFHSIPAAVLFGLLTIWLLNRFSIFQEQKLFIGLAISVGYLGHLILDEIYSSVNLKGGSILPKQSLGGALKFYSSSKWASLSFYILIFVLVLTLPEIDDLRKIFDKLWEK